MLQTQANGRKPYGNITSRINTGMPTAAASFTTAVVMATNQTRRQTTTIGHVTARGAGDIRCQGNRRYGHSLLEESRTDCKILLVPTV